jgi:hypothetical protein
MHCDAMYIHFGDGWVCVIQHTQDILHVQQID